MFNYILLASFCSTTLDPNQAFLNAILCVCMCAHICMLFMGPYMRPVSTLFSQSGKYETCLRRLQKHMCCPLSHGYRWYPSCSSHNWKQISQFSPTQTHIWCHPVDVSDDFRTVFSMAFSRYMYEWLFPSYSIIFTFSSLLAFCLLPLLFLFSLGMNFASLYFWSLFLHFYFSLIFHWSLTFLVFLPHFKGSRKPLASSEVSLLPLTLHQVSTLSPKLYGSSILYFLSPYLSGLVLLSSSCSVEFCVSVISLLLPEHENCVSLVLSKMHTF